MAKEEEWEGLSEARRAQDHRDNIARLRASVDQTSESAKLLGQMVAGLWAGMTQNGVPETQASFICQSYIAELVRVHTVQVPPPGGAQ